MIKSYWIVCSTYLVTAPKVVRPGMKYKVTVRIQPVEQDEVVAVETQLHKNNTVTGGSDVIGQTSGNFLAGVNY